MNYNNAQGYTPEQFQQWYQGQFGGPATEQQMQGWGAQVGAPAGANGMYTPAQFQQAQGLAQAGTGGGSSSFFPTFQPPAYAPSDPYQPPPAFQAPSYDEAMNDQGFQLALKQGQQAIEGSAAARGLTRTGGTLQALMQHNQGLASQQYDKVYDRAAQQYAQNYQIGRDAWGVNDATRRDARDFGYRGASDSFNSLFRGREITFDDLYKRWATGVNVNAQMALANQ